MNKFFNTIKSEVKKILSIKALPYMFFLLIGALVGLNLPYGDGAVQWILGLIVLLTVIVGGAYLYEKDKSRDLFKNKKQ